MKYKHRQSGTTMTELMVVVAIVAILLSIGVPSFRYVTNSYRMSAEVNSLLGDMQFARAEAIKEGQPIVVCTSNNTGTACSGSNSWQTGWIVFQDLNNNGQVDPNEKVLHIQAAFTGTTPDTFLPNTGVSGVSFNREGFATSTAGFVTSTFTLKDSTSNALWTRCLIVNPVGAVTTAAHSVSPGIC
jgi:type IV fimbrial biogenesis protein FimT